MQTPQPEAQDTREQIKRLIGLRLVEALKQSDVSSQIVQAAIRFIEMDTPEDDDRPVPKADLEAVRDSLPFQVKKLTTTKAK